MRFLFLLSLLAIILFATADQCGENEEFRSCATKCEPSCSDKIPSCELACGGAKCQCKDGFARHLGKCIDVRKCP